VKKEVIVLDLDDVLVEVEMMRACWKVVMTFCGE
jgi:hypothetical protein